MASISFHRADLMYALIELSKVIKKSSSIWECVAVTMKDGNAVLSGSDMKTQMSIKVACQQVGESPNFVFQFFKVFTYLKLCKSSEIVTFTYEDNKVHVTVDNLKSRSTTNALNYEDYVWLEGEKPIQKIKLPCHLVGVSMSNILHAAAKDLNVPARFQGVHIDMAKGILSLATTDGYQLSGCDTSTDDDTQSLYNSWIIPVAASEVIQKICESHNDLDVVFGASENTFILSVGNMKVVFKLQSAIYPDLHKVIKREYANHAVFSRKEMLDAMKTMRSLIKDDKLKRFTIDIASSGMTVSIHNAVKESGESSISLIEQGDDIEITLNFDYLEGALNSLECENVHMGYNNAQDSVRLYSSDNTGHLNIIMPMR